MAQGVFWVAGSGGEPSAANCGRIANVGVLIGPAGAVVIDPGPSRSAGEALARAIHRATGQQVVALVNTHAHPEHVLGNSAWSVPVWASAAAVGLMAGRCEQCLERLTREVGPEAMQGTSIRLPTQRVAVRTSLTLAGRRLLLIPFAHAHTPGDLAVLDEATGVLFAGDLAWGGEVPSLRESSLAGWRAAIVQLQALGARRVVPGHGVLSEDPLAETGAYLAALTQAVQAELDTGIDLSQVPARVPLSGWQEHPGYSREHRANVHRVYLELEAAAFGR